MELAKAYKNEAANIVKYTIKLRYLKRISQNESLRHLQTKRKLFASVRFFQRIKQEQHSRTDHCVGVEVLMASRRNTNTIIDKTAQQVASLQTKIDRLEKQVTNVTGTMEAMRDSLTLLLEKRCNYT
jgi:hypothetical protein